MERLIAVLAIVATTDINITDHRTSSTGVATADLLDFHPSSEEYRKEVEKVTEEYRKHHAAEATRKAEQKARIALIDDATINGRPYRYRPAQSSSGKAR